MVLSDMLLLDELVKFKEMSNEEFRLNASFALERHFKAFKEVVSDLEDELKVRGEG